MMNATKTTTFKKAQDVKRQWILINASGISVGRIATTVAKRISGKYQADYTPHVDAGDHVVIINASKAQLSGKKSDQKTYYSHSGYPGGIKETTAAKLISDGGVASVITKAVYGMLPANKLRKGRMMRLHVYDGSEHTHDGQKPKEIKL